MKGYKSKDSIKSFSQIKQKQIEYLVSIIIPTYNRAQLLVNCIKSCLNQTYKKVEVIVVDDGSTDNTEEVTADLCKKDSRIIYYKKENGGLASALNYGFKHAKGDYFSWTSDDNYYDKNALNKMLRFLIKNDCSFVYSDFYKFYKDSPHNLKLIQLPNWQAMKIYNCIGPSFLYSKKVWEIIGEYDPETFLAEDYDYWLRISKRFPIGHLSEPLYFYMEHQESLSLQFTRNFDIQITSLLVRIKNNIISIKKATYYFLKLILDKNQKPKLLSFKFIIQKSFSLKLFVFLWDNISFFNSFIMILLKLKQFKNIIAIFRDFKLRFIDLKKARIALRHIIDKSS